MIETEWDDERSREGLLQPRAATVCLSDEEVEDFLFDRLSGYTREAIEGHLLYCQTCLSRVEQEQDFVDVMRDACGGLEAADLEQSVGVNRQRTQGFFDGLRRMAGYSPAWGLALAGALLLMVPWGNVRPGAPVDVALRVERGEAAGGGQVAPANRPLMLRADLAGLPVMDKYVVSLVDATGRQREEQLVGASQTVSVAVPFKPCPAGQYWVRVYTADQGRELLREYSIVLR